MPGRDIPYGAYNFVVRIASSADVDGGFSDVTGLGTEFLVAEYRNGNDLENHVRKVAGLHKVSDVTLKRGLIKSTLFMTWVDQVRRTGSLARRDVGIDLLDETRTPVASWKLKGAIPMKWTGPTLAAKAHGDVAMEEVTLSCEGLEFVAV